MNDIETKNTASIFKPEDITITLGDKEYRIVYDLNSFCELEKTYDGVDEVIRMMIGTTDGPLPVVTYNNANVITDEILVDGVKLSEVIRQKRARVATHADTINILYAGLMHDAAIWNDHDEITGYNISKQRIASLVTFKNNKEIRQKMVIAMLQDLVPTEAETKNEETPEAPKTIVLSTPLKK